MRASLLFPLVALFCQLAQSQDNPGRVIFETRCARCHGSDGNGGERGPAIRNRLAVRTNPQLVTLIRQGLPGGMPPIAVSDAEMEPLTRFLRSLQPRQRREPLVRETVRTVDGKTLEGEVLNRGFAELQL